MPENYKNDIKAFLVDAKKAILEEEEIRKSINVIKGRITTFEEKEKEHKKNKELAINKTINDKKNEIENAYSEIIDEAGKRLKNAVEKKEREKKKNLQQLIDKNTKVSKENSVYLKNELKKVLKENKLPRFVNTKLYLSLYNIHSLLEFIICIFVIFITLVGIPFLVNKVLFSDKSIWIKILIYAIDILFFGILYMLIDSMTKNKAALKDVRELRKNIKDNEKEIKRIIRKVQKETTDEQFDYTKLDREIEAVGIEIKNAKENRIKTIEKFNAETRDEITKSIEKMNEAEEKEIDKTLKAANKSLIEEQKKLENTIEKNLENFGIYIGKEYMTKEKLDKLINIANSHDDISLEEIIKLYK